MKDGFLDKAPIYQMDIKEFNLLLARAYKGMVDVITAGFPCQPFSVAGKKAGKEDKRNLWPETRTSISIIRPQYVFFENVSNLLVYEYIWRILSDLTNLGYNSRWGVIPAGAVGALQQRTRWWLVANCDHANRRWKRWWKWSSEECEKTKQIRATLYQSEPIRMVDNVAHRMDRLKAIGNGQVPRVVEVAWKVLSGETLGKTSQNPHQ